MKPTSIVFLVIAALLIVGGMITCSVAKDIALTDNYTLFRENEDGSTYIRYDFAASDISKIELLITDAEINIISGAEESYLEFINFREGLYTLSTSGKVVSMDEIPDLKSIFSLQSGFSFSGMRYILRSGTVSLGEKKVNVYLTSDTSLKILSVEADNCTIRTENCRHSFDIQLLAKESLTLEAKELRTGCALHAQAPKTTLNLQECTFNTVDLIAKNASVEAKSIVWNRMNADVDGGTLDITSALTLSSDAVSVTGSGTVTLGGSEVKLPWRAEEDEYAGNVLTADIGTADLTLNWALEPIID